MGNAEKTFQAMEASRSRVCWNVWESSMKKVLARFAKSFEADEAINVFAYGRPWIILTVSKKYSQVRSMIRVLLAIIHDQIWNKNQPLLVERDINNLNRFVVSDIVPGERCPW